MASIFRVLGILSILSITASAAQLGEYKIDPLSISTSGFSSGGFMAAQLGIAYSDLFKSGFGVFAGGPYDCARDQPNTTCMFNNKPSIEIPISNMLKWSGEQIDDVQNLKDRKVFMQVGEWDRVTGPNVLSQLHQQLEEFVDEGNMQVVVTPDAEHTFPTSFDMPGNTACDISTPPFVSNCGFDGAGAVLQWLHGPLNPNPNPKTPDPEQEREPTGSILSFDQDGEHGGPGMSSTGYIYIPNPCKTSRTTCKLHVALHGCLQTADLIGDKFIRDSGYNQWADKNNIIILYPQTAVDNSYHTTWDGKTYINPFACWDWIGLYGNDTDQKGGLHMSAIVNQIQRIAGFSNSSPKTPGQSIDREL